jgi:hypothetical protein
MASAIIKGNIRITNYTYKTDNYLNKLPLTKGNEIIDGFGSLIYVYGLVS